MNDYVWLSQLEVMDSEFRDYVTTATEGLPSRQGVAASLNWQGDVVPDMAIPGVLRPGGPKPSKLGELNLLPDRFFVIGRKTAEIICQFDLGSGCDASYFSRRSQR